MAGGGRFVHRRAGQLPGDTQQHHPGYAAGDSLDESISLYNFWHERLETVESDLAPTNLLLVLEPMPEVVARDDDTADDLERKATLLENRALRDSAVVEELEDKHRDAQAAAGTRPEQQPT